MDHILQCGTSGGSDNSDRLWIAWDRLLVLTVKYALSLEFLFELFQRHLQ